MNGCGVTPAALSLPEGRSMNVSDTTWYGSVFLQLHSVMWLQYGAGRKVYLCGAGVVPDDDKVREWPER